MDKEKISVVIVDDELPARRVLETYLQGESDFVVQGSYGDSEQALEQIQKLNPGLVFLDIQMPELNGLELLAKLTDPRPYIVFVTAYDNYAVKAFEEKALDYLLKPFNKIRLDKTLNKVREVFENSLQSSQAEKLISALTSLSLLKKPVVKKLPIKDKGKITFVSVEDIIWIESSGAFSKLHLTEGLRLFGQSLKQLEDLLDPQAFIRIHKSHMINLNFIKSIEPYFHGEYIITMKGGASLKLSRGYKSRLDSILNQYK